MSYVTPYSIAQDLRDDIDEALTDAQDCVVEIDPARASSALNAGELVILIQPPRIEYVTSAVSEAEWSILVISPIRDAIEAWPIIDPLTVAVVVALNATATQYGGFQDQNGSIWPCSIVTTTTST